MSKPEPPSEPETPYVAAALASGAPGLGAWAAAQEAAGWEAGLGAGWEAGSGVGLAVGSTGYTRKPACKHLTKTHYCRRFRRMSVSSLKLSYPTQPDPRLACS